MRRLILQIIPLIMVAVPPATAQFMTSLQPRTVEEFDAYAHRVEAELQQRWDRKSAFLALDDDPAERAKVLQGDLWIQPGVPNAPAAIYAGLVHDWVGAVFIPNVDVKKVLDVLQNFDRHRQIYPEVKQSRLVSRNGDDLTGFWRLERKQSLITIVLDVTQDAHWHQVGPGKWVCRAYAKNISEIDRPGSSQESALPVGQGRGFLWRLYSYWTLEPTNGGVLGECRTLSLSRDIPPAVAWAINPFIQTLPREALSGTLRDTGTAAEK